MKRMKISRIEVRGDNANGGSFYEGFQGLDDFMDWLVRVNILDNIVCSREYSQEKQVMEKLDRRE